MQNSFLIGLLLFPCVAMCQAYKLSGTVHIKNVETCGYEAVFTVNGSKIAGHSVTRLSGVSPLYAKIEGGIDKYHHKLTFRERVDSDYEACMFDVRLSWFYFNGKYSFNGTFTGYDKDGKYCDEGEITLSNIYTPGNPFEDKPKAKPAQPAPKQENELPLKEENVKTEEFPQINSGEARKLGWNTDSCGIDVWDGGIVDGDRITMTVNGSTILSGYVLTAEKKHVMVPLTKKLNVIRITAENEGTIPPNTAKFYLWDGSMRHPVLTYLEKGSSAVIEVSKK